MPHEEEPVLLLNGRRKHRCTFKEMSFCGGWVEDEAMEHFLGIIRACEVNTQSLTGYLLEFLQDKGLDVKKCVVLDLMGQYHVRG